MLLHHQCDHFKKIEIEIFAKPWQILSDCKLWQFPAKNWPCGFLKLFNYKQTQKHISANKGCKLNFCWTRSSRCLISLNYSRITGKLYWQNRPARLLTDLETASRFFFKFCIQKWTIKAIEMPFLRLNPAYFTLKRNNNLFAKLKSQAYVYLKV